MQKQTHEFRAPDGKRVRTVTTFSARCNPVLASAVARELRRNGGDLKKAIKKVAKDKKTMAKARGAPGAPEEPVAPPAPAAQPAEDHYRRWLLAICRRGKGGYGGLSNDELADLAALEHPAYQGFDAWAQDRFPASE